MKSPDIFTYEHIKEYVASLMPPQPIRYVVKKEDQQREIDSLKATIGGRRCFFITNLEHFEIEQPHGISQWLGFSEKDFTMKWYLNHVVHPGKKKSIILIAQQLYSALCKGKYSLNFMVQRYNSLVALRHYNGNYLLANKISSVFQYDTQNRLTAYINEFTIIGDYAGQPLDPGFFNDNGNFEPRGLEILQSTIKHFLEMGIFTDRQIQVARIMAYNPNIKKAKIAQSLNIEESTVIEFGKRFKQNAELFFHRKFATVAEAAFFLRKEGLL